MTQDKRCLRTLDRIGKPGGGPTNGTEAPVRSLGYVGWYGCDGGGCLPMLSVSDDWGATWNPGVVVVGDTQEPINQEVLIEYNSLKF